MNPAPILNTSKLKYTIKCDSEESDSEDFYNFVVLRKGENLTFTFENLESFPVKIYELKIKFIELRKQDKNFVKFQDAEELMGGIKKFIDSKNYKVRYDKEENNLIFEMENNLFVNNVAKLKIPEKHQDLESQVKSLTNIVTQLRNQLKKNKKDKNESAVNTFQGTSLLNDEEKKLISKWIDPNKIIKFYLLFSTSKDGDSSLTFHTYCDGESPTVTIVKDISGIKFGGYSTQSWSQSTCGASYSRAPCSFIFNLSNKKRYDLIDQFNTTAIYRDNSYGPTFGGGQDLYISNGCTSNAYSICNKHSYNTGNNNLLVLSGSTNFQVSIYEVFKVVFE